MPRKPSPEEEWLNEPESGDPGPTGEGDLAPWMQPGSSSFPMASKVFYINAYTLIQLHSSFKDNLNRYGNSHKVGVMAPGTEIGSDNYYTPFASAPVRQGDRKAKDSIFAYLVWLIKSVKLGFTRIETEDSFPAAEYNPHTQSYESTVRLADGRWFPFKMDQAFQHKKLQFVNAYTVNRYVGGEEEGGWWYDAGDPIASIPIKKGFEVTENKFKDYLTNNIGWHSKYDLSSVLGHDKFDIATEGHFAERWPRETPHYE